MANTATNVSVGKPNTTGAIYRAPWTATLPTDATSTLGIDFKPLGYISEDGVENDTSIESDSIKAWGGDTVYSVQKSRDDTFKFTMIESLNTEAMKVYYGDNAVSGTVASGISISVSNKDLGNHAYVIEEIHRNGRLKRIVIPDAQVTEVEPITYKDDELVGYGVTLTCNQDSNGYTHYEYYAGNAT